MTDATQSTTAATTAAATTAATTTPAATTAAWYEGKADAETLGHWQNKGWKLDDPASIAIEATKAAREAQKFVGVPADQLLRLPKDANDEAGWKGVYSRLGVPTEAKDYDFSAVKHADGNAPEAALLDSLRAAALNSRVPKDRATELANAVIKHLDGQKAAAAAEHAANLASEKTALKQSWGQNEEFNRLTAMQGAKRLGVDQETVTKLESVIGYAKVMEMFRKVGAGTSEATFTEGKPGNQPTTQEGASARMAELGADKEWTKRLLAGGAAERREWDALMRQISGVAA